ncbi:hypothetical protein GCM10008955_36700 [Deinococcus malanensis]|uniref:Knr4/Smi1-like domain-containing protein n=1 Tax=Deinococcus malanensis TaxID=1706855 RepID=A0ABQ2F0V3_9DEIO|nr:SMI1/KNR4 family protein [Deinococcus malanensis]GGK39533.1 hypothetical protein GCM10008955_36700 [Deinococcus malanensis]
MQLSDIQPVPGARPVTQIDLDAFETSRGVTLSPHHRYLLLIQDGGVLPEGYVPIPDAPVLSAQPTFWHGLGSGELEDEYDWYEEMIGPDLVPFCSDPAGSVFCYRLQPTGTERISRVWSIARRTPGAGCRTRSTRSPKV